MRVAYNKLVRDQIPDIIAAAGSRPSTRVLDHASYQGALRSKLLEEAQEAEVAPDEQLASELADVLEVLRALATAHGMTWEDIELQARRKRAERGGFDRRIFLEHVDQVLEADAGVAAFTCMCWRAKRLLETPIAASLSPVAAVSVVWWVSCGFAGVPCPAAMLLTCSRTVTGGPTTRSAEPG